MNKRFTNWPAKYCWALLIACIIAICIFPLPHKIDTTKHGVQLRLGDDDLYDDVAITIKGVYKQYLFKNDTFEGKLSIDIYENTHGVSIRPTPFNDGYISLYYDYDFSKIHNFGFLLCTPTFSKLFIGVNEPTDPKEPKGWNGGDGLIICAPADKPEDAIEIARTLSRKSKWLSGGTFLE